MSEPKLSKDKQQPAPVKGVPATATVCIGAAVRDVWNALVTPSIIKQYMFGAEVVSDWEQGSPIMWKGEWEGKPYEDKGTILSLTPDKELQYSHYSPMSGLPDTPANYHTVTYRLEANGPVTDVTLTQDNNKDKKAAEHSAAMWQAMLDGLKKVVESTSG